MKSIENEVPEKEDKLISKDRKDILELLGEEIKICKERLV